ncbi:hypothetical protein Pcinc_018246 [Petrolisthes cinctipes]|uniref:Uncharacterized protein n=1 Tax=Petrolisthes cinctipes TaxID=88211 RepID=A0AAE1KP10_PETCI|nr:hypothetical protein Pcinc_018246 [Petrolisthes cinctipes]
MSGGDAVGFTNPTEKEENVHSKPPIPCHGPQYVHPCTGQRVVRSEELLFAGQGSTYTSLAGYSLSVRGCVLAETTSGVQAGRLHLSSDLKNRRLLKSWSPSEHPHAPMLYCSSLTCPGP